MNKVVFALSLVGFLSACSDDNGSSDDNAVAGKNAGGKSTGVAGAGGKPAATAGQGGAAGTGDTDAELTLENCGGMIADGVPEFYKTYFKCSDISVSGDNVVIKSTGLPPHKSAYYPEDSPNWTEFDTSRGDMYKINPNQIAEQNLVLTIPLAPSPSGKEISETTVDGVVNGAGSDDYPMGAAGVALDGVVLFSPLAAAGADIEDEKYTFDSYSGHPEKFGGYHNHSAASGPLEVLKILGKTDNTTPGSAAVELFGIMCDGTVLLGCTELDGSAPATGDLDAQNGHVHDVSDGDGVTLADRYHVHACTSLGRAYTPEVPYYSTCEVD